MDTQGTRYILCSGCGLQLPDKQLSTSDKFNASGECRELYHELSYYTLNKGDADFIHEVIVDTYGAQHAGGPTNKISVFFAVVGLYLYLEKGYTGKEARQAHVTMAQHKGYDWPVLQPLPQKDWLTVADVLKAQNKDTMIHEWAVSTWDMWQKDRDIIATICSKVL